MIRFLRGGARNTYAWLLLPITLIGCQSVPHIDVASDTARLTGIDGAIAIHDTLPDDESAQANENSLTMVVAVRLALQHDPRIQSALAHVRGAESDARQSRHLPNPILNVDVRFPQRGPETAIEATLSEDVISLLSKPAQNSAADNRLRAAAADALTTVLDVIAEVQEAYASAQSIESEVIFTQQQGQTIARMRDLAQKRFDAGEGKRLDVLILDTQRSQLSVTLSDLRLSGIEQRLILARLIGQPRGRSDWQLEPWQAPANILTNESTWIDAALTTRPEILSRIWQMAAAGNDIDVATLAPLAGGDMGAHAEHDPQWRIGPTITTPVPIFDMGQDTRAKARSMYFAARQDLQQERLAVIEEVRRAYANYRAAQETLLVAKNELLPLQENEHQQTELAYQSGDTDLATLLLAETDLQTTRSRVVELQEKMVAALVRLQRAAGGAGISARLESASATTQAAATQPAITTPGTSATSRPDTGSTP